MRILVTALMMALAAPALAAPGGDYGSTAPADTKLTAALGLINAGRTAEAIALLEVRLAQRPRDADALNLMGFAHRKAGDFGQARVFYTRALEQNAEHEGALAYFGVLELEEGNAEAARALLTRLQSICWLGCDALDELEAEFDARGVAVLG